MIVEGGAMSSRREKLERTWVIGVVLFVSIRFVLAYSVIADEDQLTVIVFGLLDLGTAVPYAIATARLVTSLVDRQPQSAFRWGIIASAAFLAPYLWLAWAGRDGSFPPVVYVAIVMFVVCLGLNAIFSIRRKMLEGRRDHQIGGAVPAGAALVGDRLDEIS